MDCPAALFDAGGVLTFLNETGALLLNGTPPDFTGKSVDALFFDQAEPIKKLISRVFDTRQKQVLTKPVPMGPRGPLV